MTEVFLASFKRSQVEWALWQSVHFRTGEKPPEEISKSYLFKVKRLLEIDSKLVESSAMPMHAFLTAEESPGIGADRNFSIFDAFFIGLGIELLNAGFNPQDTIYLLQHIRKTAKQEFLAVLGSGKRDLIHLKKYLANKNIKVDLKNDNRSFLVIKNIELTEILNSKLKSKARMHEPVFLHGLSALTLYLNFYTNHYTHHSVLEISGLARLLEIHLPEAPLVKRGRKSNKKGAKSNADK